MKNVHLSLCKTDFQCPICACINGAEVWQDKYFKCKTGVIKIKCKFCKRKLNFSLDLISEPLVSEWVKGSLDGKVIDLS